jgi:hypothetical protein
LRRFTEATLRRRHDVGRVQLRADLWSEMLADPTVREPFVATLRRRRRKLQGWIESSVPDGDPASAPPRALATVALALLDGLTLHRAIDPTGFQWANVLVAVDRLLSSLDAESP